MRDDLQRDFDGLFAAHCNRTATAAERERLVALAADDAASAAAIADVDELHALFAAERAAAATLGVPLSAGEASDEGAVRLERAAARAEDRLRHRLLAGAAGAPGTAVGTPLRAASWRRWWPYAAAAAALLLIGLASLLGGGVDRPELLPGRPADGVLGGVGRITLEAELTLSRPVLTWHAVVGAASYDVVIATADGEPVAARPASAARSTRFELDAGQVDAVAARRGGALVLRVVARDGLGSVLATTGDLPLRLVD